MRLSGVDPSIIRELSGIYKPFVKAFKELVSNAYDADATAVTVAVARDFSSIDVHDNGLGLTPIEFHRDFARLGGSTAWLNQGRSPGGRPRIGYKGIGFLAVARYCSRMEIESATRREHADRITVRGRRRSVDVAESLEPLVPAKIGRTRLRVIGVSIAGLKPVRLKSGTDYVVRDGRVHIKSARALGASRLEIRYSLACADLVLKAAIDFDYLLGLERKADLQLLENFCEAEVRVASRPRNAGTKIRLTGLKDFVIRDLAASRHKGKGWNIGSQSGKEQFIWRLARAVPIEDAIPDGPLPEVLAKLRRVEKSAKLPRVFVQWRDESAAELTRAVALPKNGAPADSIVPVAIHEGELTAQGYLLAQNEVIYPAELRGITIRVRNVAIGDPSFFGLERTLAGARKAALSQISGEVVVLDGLDAADAINPGRESFYEENGHFRVLKRALIGDEDALGGAVGQAIRLITDRGNIRGQVTDKLGSARARRKVLTDISSAVNTIAQVDTRFEERLTQFLAAPVVANGLANAKEILLRPVSRLAGFELEETKGLLEEFAIDFARRAVSIDFTRDIWSQSIYLRGAYYEVSFKQGLPTHPMCEFDNASTRIYVNWAHPVKQYMDDYGFLRSAIVWRLAYHLASDSADGMIEVALRMLAHRAE
jgi:histidine kinase/DNA gyrase B/HSP90-like ATPase